MKHGNVAASGCDCQEGTEEEAVKEEGRREVEGEEDAWGGVSEGC